MLRTLQIDSWPGTLFMSYIHMHIHILHTHTHTPLYKELYVYYMYYIMNVHTICCNNSVYYLYISLFLCEPTLQIQMTKKFVGCIDFYCKFQGSNYFCLCFIPQTKLSMFFLFLQNFLLLDEISQLTTQLPSDDKTTVHMKDFTAFWDKVISPPFLDHDC